MSGTLMIYLWGVDGESGQLEHDASVYRFPFTAVRMTSSGN